MELCSLSLLWLLKLSTLDSDQESLPDESPSESYTARSSRVVRLFALVFCMCSLKHFFGIIKGIRWELFYVALIGQDSFSGILYVVSYCADVGVTTRDNRTIVKVAIITNCTKSIKLDFIVLLEWWFGMTYIFILVTYWFFYCCLVIFNAYFLCDWSPAILNYDSRMPFYLCMWRTAAF